ncbi:MAG: 23S rRNA (pseudouridine(1915)-N(3))-methyltransferase RlmH [Flavobacteriia bacterium]|nr:23S rRNA (pseudouridine(1915)-N(3))-methyltransferase RlmH [Flavobacteriia bacterium]
MKIKFITIGKTSKKYLKEGEDDFIKRLKHYCSLEIIELKDIYNSSTLSHDLLKKAEYEQILKHLNKNDFIILLDEKGKMFRSKEFANFIENKQLESVQTIVFIIGGAFGFFQDLYPKSNFILSLSSMTFSHQMIRVIFLEQLYRAFTIIKGEKYHHE